MEIVIEQKELLKGLQRVQGVVDAKGAIPILSHVLIEVYGDGMWIFSTDLKIGIKGFYPGTVKKDGRVTVPARRLFDIVRELPSGPISLCSEKETDEHLSDNWIYITSGKYNCKLPTFSAEIYPSFPSYGDDFLATFKPNVLKEMIKRTIFSVALEEGRPALMGTLIELKDDNICMVSTDGHRLSFASAKNIKQMEKVFSIILPLKTSIELLKFVDTSEEDILFSVYENQAVFRQGKMVLVSRLIEEGQYPNYESVIPPEGESFAVIRKSQLQGALRRVSLLSEEKSKLVKFDLKKDALLLLADNSEIGEARESLSVKSEIESILIGLNAKYILEVLNVIEEDEIILFAAGPKSPALFMPVKDKGFKSVIMPMRINQKESAEEAEVSSHHL